MAKDYGTIIYRKETRSYVVGKLCVPHPDDDTVPDEVRRQFAELWADVDAYAEAHPEMVTEEQPYVPPVPTLEELKIAKKARIDAETSAAIASGFDYAVDGVTYHFSYDAFDQQNFADTANVCLMKQSGMPGLPDSVTWNAYTPDGDMVRPDVRCIGLPRALRGRGHEAQERDDAARRGTQGGGGGRGYCGRG